MLLALLPPLHQVRDTLQALPPHLNQVTAPLQTPHQVQAPLKVLLLAHIKQTMPWMCYLQLLLKL